MKSYKLTDENDQTRNGTQWGENVTHEADGLGDLCGPGWLHYYDDPLLAVLHNPIHGNFDDKTMHLWEIEAEGAIKKEGQMKSGCTKMTTTQRINIPTITNKQRIKYSILCALQVRQEKMFVEWANKWLSGEDQSEESAEEASVAAEAARAAAEAARAAAAEEEAAWAAAEAARVARDARAAWSAAEAARDARAATVAAWAAEAATEAADLDLVELAHQAMEP